MNNEALFKEREQLIIDTVHLEAGKRVPVLYMGQAFAPHYMGMSMAEFCSNQEAPHTVTVAAMDRLGGFDGVNFPSIGLNTPVLPAVWLSKVLVPGRELPADALWQIHEQEVMTIDDYDAIINKGWGPFIQSYLPKVITDMKQFGETIGWVGANKERALMLYREHGYLPLVTGAGTIPFENFCGGRSMQKFFFDLYRIPDKVQAAMDVVLPDAIAGVVNGTKFPNVSRMNAVWIGGWRSASALVAPKLWNRFVWPYIVKMVDALIDAGLTPVLHWDQDWTRDLIHLQELPAKKVILNPDGMTNLKKFKELAGDRMAMMGDVPASMLTSGTPEDVRKYVRELIELFEGKGLLICPGCDGPINTKPENIEAMVAAGHEFGG